MISPKVINATVNNAESILQFVRTFFPYHKTSVNSIANNILNGKHFYLLAVADGKAVGFVDVALRKNSAIILGMAVKSDYRNNGVGTELLQTALKKIKMKGFNVTYLLVQTNNVNAIQLYLANGFLFRRVSKVPVNGKEAYLLVRLETD